MNIQQALRKEKRIRRKAWVNSIYWEFSKLTLDEYDILAEDWEVEGEDEVEIPTEITFSRKNSSITFEKDGSDVGIAIEDLVVDYGYFAITEKEVDKLLDFLYYNTKIGNDRITPF